jgi:uncharacterized protein YlxP (DUF503 family)
VQFEEFLSIALRRPIIAHGAPGFRRCDHQTRCCSSEAPDECSESSMVVGIGIITFRLHECRSLKSKRKIVKSIVHQVRNKFNVSIAEVGSNDIYQRADIGFSLVGNNRRVLNSKMDKMLNMIDALGLAEVIDTELELINI